MFHTNKALREVVKLESCPRLFGAENAFSSGNASRNRNNEDDDDDDDPVTARWSTTFTWNMTRPPPLPPSAGGVVLAKGDLATTLFVAVYGDTIDDDTRRAEVSGEGEARGVNEGDDAELLWALGVATRVSFRLGGRLKEKKGGEEIEQTCTVCVGISVHVFDYHNIE